jgi:polysaccharide biosynthesis protein PslG
MEDYGDSNKQIWLTEFGWSTKNEAPGYEYGSVISEQLQAQYIVRAFEKGQKDYPWMGVMFLWTLNHSVVVPPTDEKYPWAVIRGDWSPRPAYDAIKNMAKPR